MILTWLAPIWQFLKSVSREVWYLIAAALLLWWVYNLGYGEAEEDMRAQQAEEARQIAEKTRNADEVARGAVAREKATSDEKTERAREAARNSEDPLRDAMRELNR